MTRLNADDDLKMIYARFRSWRRCRWGSAQTPIAVAFVKLIDERWHVFATFSSRPEAVAYVTTAHTPDPIRPGHVVWLVADIAGRAADSLTKVTPVVFFESPVALPAQCRLPANSPNNIRP